jgi:outer membrane protein
LRKLFCRDLRWLLVIASVFAHAGAARAEGIVTDLSDSDDTGFTVLSNATNVTHWGLGAGVGYEQAPYKSYGAKYSPLPLFYFDDKWVHAAGTTIDLKIGKWSNVLFSLRGQYAIGDGYKGSDAAVLNGMQTRNGAFWYGPALSWHTAYGTLSGELLTGGNKGQKASVEFGKAFAFSNLSIEPHVGFDWLSRKYVDYYYGVRSNEVRPGRGEYNGKSTYDVSIGTKFDYQVTRHQLATLDLGVSYLGSGITDSPIIGKKFVPEVKLGYLYQFK